MLLFQCYVALETKICVYIVLIHRRPVQETTFLISPVLVRELRMRLFYESSALTIEPFWGGLRYHHAVFNWSKTCKVRFVDKKTILLHTLIRRMLYIIRNMGVHILCLVYNTKLQHKSKWKLKTYDVWFYLIWYMNCKCSDRPSTKWQCYAQLI